MSWDSLVFWSMEKGVCLKKSDPGYPEALEILMGEDAPSSLWTRGALPILDRPVVAIFCSQSCTGLAATRAYDVVQALRHAGVVIASGFQSPLEQACCDLYRKSPLPIVAGLARHLPGARLPSLLKPFLASQRLLVVSRENEEVRRVTAASAFRRNLVLAALADRIFIPHASLGSKTARFLDFAFKFGKKIFAIEEGDLVRVLPASKCVTTSVGSIFDGL